ncbi:MAG TPA: response regulator, partial [Cellvibrio sp.]|nr:response regulator [Cellvibrio sp.]
VLINLVGNAIKFTERGSIVVDIQKVAEYDKHVDLRFSIKDTGIGIPPENQAQIFSAFSQADVSTTRRFGGTGLGLTICRHLVKLMGGDIGVNSEPDKGSEFWFTVPLDFVPHGEKNRKPEKLDILIVDGNPLASENLERIVQSLGWSGKRASSGEIAIQKLQEKIASKGKFDAILIDWKMGDGTGADVAKMIQKVYKNGLPPIILMMPGFTRDETPIISSNVSSLLTKPVTSSSLYNIIVDVLQPNTKQHNLTRTKKNKIKRLMGLHVLVVDDNAVNREVAMRFLTSEGAEVSVAEDGKMAVEWITTHLDALDLVLMDVQMPVMDGYEATRYLRSLPECTRLPIIALTAGVFETQIDAAREAGMNTVITKPFNIDDLVNAILQVEILKLEKSKRQR